MPSVMPSGCKHQSSFHTHGHQAEHAAQRGRDGAGLRNTGEMVQNDVETLVHDGSACSDRGWNIPPGQRAQTRSLDDVGTERSYCPGRQNVAGRHRVSFPEDHVPGLHGGRVVGV